MRLWLVAPFARGRNLRVPFRCHLALWYVGPRIGMKRALAGWLLLASACAERREPPGAELRAEPAPVQAVGSAEPPKPAASSLARELGTLNDNAPFEPTGLKIASIASRTWVYTDTGPKRRRYGYLRAGAVLDARGPELKNDGCEGGWYRINPRGFVCVGRGATLDLEHPVVKIAGRRPTRGEGLPYLYALANEPAPFLYFRPPRREEMVQIEGSGVIGRGAMLEERARREGWLGLLGEPVAPPEFSMHAIEKPYGAHQRLHYTAHSGRAAKGSGFAVMQVFTWEERRFGLTTEHDLVALDRTQVVRPSEFRGVELTADEALPVAFVDSRWGTLKYAGTGDEPPKAAGQFGYREGVKLTGRERHGLLETRDGHWLPVGAARVIPARSSFPSFATGTRQWLDISIKDQTLVAYVGTQPVYATLVSAGRGGLADPEESFATVRGTFMVHTKHVSTTMDGEDDKIDSYNLQDVPFVQYFHKGYALHGTYWHDEFGKERSHGCINLAPIDAAWLFEWTFPVVPPDWHGVLNFERGTVVHIRP